MLSVLIPTYNHNILPLVESLYKQLKKERKPFEIICFDNGSNVEISLLNREINKLDHCTYKLLKKNGGRSKTRNMLAEQAKYGWLLFLDADVLPVEDNFISVYYDSIKEDNIEVAFGGLKYKNQPETKKMLRWVYGKAREEIPVQIRQDNPQEYFTSANFIIKKQIFNQYKFDESLVDYGYEDTLLAIELTRNNIKITQLDNPVYHLGIDESNIFLEKTRESVNNLLGLYRKGKVNSDNFKILKVFEKAKSLGILNLIRIIFTTFSGTFEKNLLSKKPSLLIYDLYKIGYLSLLYSKKK